MLLKKQWQNKTFFKAKIIKSYVDVICKKSGCSDLYYLFFIAFYYFVCYFEKVCKNIFKAGFYKIAFKNETSNSFDLGKIHKMYFMLLSIRAISKAELFSSNGFRKYLKFTIANCEKRKKNKNKKKRTTQSTLNSHFYEFIFGL